MKGNYTLSPLYTICFTVLVQNLSSYFRKVQGKEIKNNLLHCHIKVENAIKW